MGRRFRVIIQQEQDGSYYASVAGLPGCFSAGDTLDELREHVKEAIQLYLEDDDAPAAESAFATVETIEVPA